MHGATQIRYEKIVTEKKHGAKKNRYEKVVTGQMHGATQRYEKIVTRKIHSEAKYQKNVEAYHNRSGGMKPNIVPNCIRSENYMITFEVEEEKFPFFGKKYQLKFASDVSAETQCLVHFPSLLRLAREAGLEHMEIQNLTDFYDDNSLHQESSDKLLQSEQLILPSFYSIHRAQFLGMLQDAGHNFIDPRGRLLPRSYDILGLYTTFIFQKPDPEIAPPLTTPFMPVGTHYLDEMEWQVILWDEEEKSGQTDSSTGLGKITEQKGILGPGPAELRFTEAI
ncbi:mRNA cap guanine-N7 methyltransferase 2 [Capsicum annuum]|nr:mRNA cap guanine-N7 methyltransferase 2 [Capsicum annuum]